MYFSWVRPSMEARLGFAFRVGRGGGASNLVGVLGALLSSHRIVCYLAASGVGTHRLPLRMERIQQGPTLLPALTNSVLDREL